jgi:hypothetical protein
MIPTCTRSLSLYVGRSLHCRRLRSPAKTLFKENNRYLLLYDCVVVTIIDHVKGVEDDSPKSASRLAALHLRSRALLCGKQWHDKQTTIINLALIFRNFPVLQLIGSALLNATDLIDGTFGV